MLGASGAVGQVALAVARQLGGRPGGRRLPIGGRRAAGDRGAALTTGSCCDPDEERADLAGRLTAAAGGPVDVVIDPVFGEPAAAAALALGPGGRLVNLGGAAHDRGRVLLGRPPGQQHRHPRLHQQRDLRRAASRCADLGAGPGRPGRGGRGPPGIPAGRLREAWTRPGRPDPASSSPSTEAALDRRLPRQTTAGCASDPGREIDAQPASQRSQGRLADRRITVRSPLLTTTAHPSTFMGTFPWERSHTPMTREQQ